MRISNEAFRGERFRPTLKSAHAYFENSLKPVPLMYYLEAAARADDLIAPLPNSFDMGELIKEAKACSVLSEAHTVIDRDLYEGEGVSAVYVTSTGELQMPSSIKSYGINILPWGFEGDMSLLLGIHGFAALRSIPTRVFTPLEILPNDHEAAVGILIATPSIISLLLRSRQPRIREYTDFSQTIGLPKGMSEYEEAYVFQLSDIAQLYGLALYTCFASGNITIQITQ